MKKRKKRTRHQHRAGAWVRTRKQKQCLPRIWSFNARSINNKIPQLKARIEEARHKGNEPHIIAITEPWLHDDIPKDRYDLSSEGYILKLRSRSPAVRVGTRKEEL
eukprot:Lithocolla_globosa_v1_NODE_136_length_5835_cov_11.826644.p10 type:complete len:106 gc:universal NODE_136_length_5835_cov_11.826644:5276-4959(-)